jgi:hypothetical protein
MHKSACTGLDAIAAGNCAVQSTLPTRLEHGVSPAWTAGYAGPHQSRRCNKTVQGNAGLANRCNRTALACTTQQRGQHDDQQ